MLYGHTDGDNVLNFFFYFYTNFVIINHFATPKKEMSKKEKRSLQLFIRCLRSIINIIIFQIETLNIEYKDMSLFFFQKRCHS